MTTKRAFLFTLNYFQPSNVKKSTKKNRLKIFLKNAKNTPSFFPSIFQPEIFYSIFTV